MSGGRDSERARDRDQGAQPERTRLAWRRTTLTFAVSAALGVRSVISGGGPASVTAVAAAVGTLAWLAFLALSHRRITRMAQAAPEALGGGQAQAVVVCTLAMVIVGMVLLW